MRGLTFRLKLALVIITGCLLVFGCIEISESLRFRSPRTVTFAQFEKEMPQEGWFHIKDAQLFVLESAFEEDKSSHNMTKAFVPVGSATDLTSDSKKQTFLLMESRDPAILDTVRDAQQITDQKSAAQYVTAHRQTAYPVRDVEGMIKTGLHSDSKTHAELSKLDNALAPNYVILQEGKHPSLGLGIGMLMGGILLGVGQVLFYISRRTMR